MAQRYGKRPSEIFGIKHDGVAIDFDFAMLMIGLRAESNAIDKRRETTRRHSPAESMQYLADKFGKDNGN